MSAAERALTDLLQLMAKLRDPERGCPWDVKQNFASIAPYTIEEAYEVADAIDRQDWHDLRDELGDLLLQGGFRAKMAKEAGLFDFDHVAPTISDKMLRRHPHVFGQTSYDDLEAQKQGWEDIKRAERAAKGEDIDDNNALAGGSHGLPEWKRPTKLKQRAAKVGFDWPN